MRSASRAGARTRSGRCCASRLDGLFFQTTALLRWIVYFGFVMAASSVALAAYLRLRVLSTRAAYPGWTSLAVLLLLIGGFIIISVGLTGLYLGKVFEQVKGRPLFVVDERRRVGELDAAEVELAEVARSTR